MYNAAEKLEDAVAVLTSRFYNNLSYNFRDSDSIAAYYAADAVSTEGVGSCCLSKCSASLVSLMLLMPAVSCSNCATVARS
jgi:hypothetical protein